MRILKQSTAATVVLGPFVDSTDGFTAETALTIAQADVRLSKNAGTFAQKGDATSCSHMENGYYSCPLSTADTGTIGRLTIAVAESGALPVVLEYTVLVAAAYDALTAGTGAGLLADAAASVGTRSLGSAYSNRTYDEVMKLSAAALAGKASGMGTSTAVFRNLADNADVITATVDANGNRTAVTLNP
jgi:hypothetical protein